MPAFVAPTILPLAGPRTLTSISVARPVPIYPANSRRCTVRRATITALEPLVLSEDNVNLALEEVKEKLGSMFGNSVENRGVGITGDVQLASTDGPIVVVRLTGRFWHKRSDVLARVGAYLTERIPEICDIEIEDPRQLEDSEEETSRLS